MADVDHTIHQINSLHEEGEIAAIASVVLTKTGQCLVFVAYPPGTGFALVGGASVMQHDLMCLVAHSAETLDTAKH